jgi:hypothetical protein
MNWQSSGIDSGPPQTTFSWFLWRDLREGTIIEFVVAGLITSLIYGLVARKNMYNKKLSME